MDKLMFFDVITHKNGHYWFYNYNVLCAVLQTCRQVGYCTLFENLDMTDILKKEGICVYECERLFPYLTSRKKRSDSIEIFYKIKNVLKGHMTILPSQITESIKRYFVFCKKRNLYKELLVYTNSIIRKEGYNSLHIFELDVMLFNYFINIFKQFDVPLTATLHWFPVNPQSKKTLYRLITDGILKKLIVHGDFIRKSVLELVGDRFANVVQSIEYPSNGKKDISVEEAKKIVGWGKKCINQPVFLCFGTIRYDKGLDILLKALSGVEGNYSLVIAGKEGNYGYNYIKKRIRQYNIKGDIILDLKYIPNKVADAYFKLSDIVVLPYRRFFGGQSGPLTEGVNFRSIILTSDVGQIGYTVRQYDLGLVFRAEDVKDLNKKIIFLLKHYKKEKERIYVQQSHYQKMTDIANFKAFYNKLFDTY